VTLRGQGKPPRTRSLAIAAAWPAILTVQPGAPRHMRGGRWRKRGGRSWRDHRRRQRGQCNVQGGGIRRGASNGSVLRQLQRQWLAAPHACFTRRRSANSEHFWRPRRQRRHGPNVVRLRRPRRLHRSPGASRHLASLGRRLLGQPFRKQRWRRRSRRLRGRSLARLLLRRRRLRRLRRRQVWALWRHRRPQGLWRFSHPFEQRRRRRGRWRECGRRHLRNQRLCLSSRWRPWGWRLRLQVAVAGRPRRAAVAPAARRGAAAAARPRRGAIAAAGRPRRGAGAAPLGASCAPRSAWSGAAGPRTVGAPGQRGSLRLLTALGSLLFPTVW